MAKPTCITAQVNHSGWGPVLFRVLPDSAWATLTACQAHLYASRASWLIVTLSHGHCPCCPSPIPLLFLLPPLPSLGVLLLEVLWSQKPQGPCLRSSITDSSTIRPPRAGVLEERDGCTDRRAGGRGRLGQSGKGFVYTRWWEGSGASGKDQTWEEAGAVLVG